MTIICSVAAVFNNSVGDKYVIRPSDIGIIKPDVPEWVKDTQMFKWLESDGSVKFVTSSNKVEAENDPLNGLGADGKKIEEPVAVKEEPVAVEVEAPKKTTRKKKAEVGDAT